jgi:hypothetical protein
MQRKGKIGEKKQSHQRKFLLGIHSGQQEKQTQQNKHFQGGLNQKHLSKPFGPAFGESKNYAVQKKKEKGKNQNKRIPFSQVVCRVKRRNGGMKEKKEKGNYRHPQKIATQFFQHKSIVRVSF